MIENEKAILCKLLHDNKQIKKLLPYGDIFTDRDCKEIYRIIRHYYDICKTFDMLKIKAEIDEKKTHLTDQKVYDIFNFIDHKLFDDKKFYFHLTELYEYYLHQQIQKSFNTGGNLQEIQSLIQKGLFQIDIEDTSMHIKNYLMQRLDNQIETKEYIKTGWKFFDDNNGIPKKTLTIIAARPSDGKTSLAINMIKQIGYSAGNVGMISIEEPLEDIYDKMICSESRIDLLQFQQNIHIGSTSYSDRVVKAAEKLYETNIIVNEVCNLTVDGLYKTAIMMIQKYNLDCIVLDYLQKIKGGSQYRSKVDLIEEASGMCKEIAKTQNVSFIALAQMNRDIDQRQEFKPRFSDLKGSGAIEQDADIIMFLEPQCRDENTDNYEIKCHVSKYRSGAKGDFRLSWDRGKYAID